MALVLLIFLVQGGWPVPAMNEPHYLSKAKHYWDPSWCPRDFFLASADAHQVFYWTFGAVSKIVSLEAFAWTGRLLTWLLMAIAWTRLAAYVAATPLAAALSAGLFVALNYHAQMAGEWVIGGLEAKGFSYALVLFALGCLVRHQWRTTWLLLGAASAIHILVGGWATIAAGVCWLVEGRRHAPLRSQVWALSAGALLALPGVLSALSLTRGVPREIINQANIIYVYERLPHHLLPQTFPTPMVARHVALVCAWLAVCMMVRGGDVVRLLRTFVMVCIGFSVVGWLIALAIENHPALTASLMRYYWFRMSDTFVPAGVALLAVRGVGDSLARRPRAGLALLAATMLLVCGHLASMIIDRREDPRPPADKSMADVTQWQDTCRWVRDNTPPDSLFIVPRLSQTFRWYAHRSEVVCRKDVPQDAQAIVAWHQRLHDIYLGNVVDGVQTWHDALSEVGKQRVIALGRKYHADFVITYARPPLALELVNPANPSYAVYRLPPDPTRQRSPKPAGRQTR